VVAKCLFEVLRPCTLRVRVRPANGNGQRGIALYGHKSSIGTHSPADGIPYRTVTGDEDGHPLRNEAVYQTGCVAWFCVFGAGGVVLG